MPVIKHVRRFSPHDAKRIFERCSLFAFQRREQHTTTTVTEENPVKPFSSVPCPPRLPLIGHLHLFSKFGPYSFERIYDAYADLHKQYGPIVRLDLGIPLLLLFSPDDIQQMFSLGEKYPQRPLFQALKHYREKRKDVYSCAGLVSENGEEWFRLRRAVNFIMNPPFAHSYFPYQEEIADDFVSRLRQIRDPDGKIPNFLQEIYRYTEEAIGLVCFGTRLGLLGSQKEFSAQLTEAADNLMKAMADTLLGFPWWKFFPTPSYRKIVRSSDFFQSFSAKCMKEAEERLNDPRFQDDGKLQFIKRIAQNEKLKPSDISLLMTEIFSAGIDATGNVIGFFLYNLTKKPDVQEKLYADIQKHCHDGLSVETIANMKYLKACIQESHRLTPTTGGNARILSSSTVFSGYHVPEKVLCIGLNPIICQQEDNFENAMDFNPDRWLDDTNTKPHPYCVLPFSHGVRRCVGQRFAEQEIRLCLIKIIQKFRVEYEGLKIGSVMRMSLIPDKPLNFKFIER